MSRSSSFFPKFSVTVCKSAVAFCKSAILPESSLSPFSIALFKSSSDLVKRAERSSIPFCKVFCAEVIFLSRSSSCFPKFSVTACNSAVVFCKFVILPESSLSPFSIALFKSSSDLVKRAERSSTAFCNEVCAEARLSLIVLICSCNAPSFVSNAVFAACKTETAFCKFVTLSDNVSPPTSAFSKSFSVCATRSVSVLREPCKAFCAEVIFDSRSSSFSAKVSEASCKAEITPCRSEIASDKSSPFSITSCNALSAFSKRSVSASISPCGIVHFAVKIKPSIAGTLKPYINSPSNQPINVRVLSGTIGTSADSPSLNTSFV